MLSMTVMGRGLAALLIVTAAGGAHAVEPLDLLFGTTGPAAPPSTGAPRDDAAQVRAFVRDRMKQSKFYETVLPRLFEVFSNKPTPRITRHVLRVAQVNGRTVLSMVNPDGAVALPPDRPCDLTTLIKVVPWWDSTASVWVCPREYRPEANFDRIAAQEQYCEAGRSDRCACGPHLIYCAPLELRNKLLDAVAHEPMRTAQEIIQRHLPFSALLTTNETMRPALLDLHYQRAVQQEHVSPFHWRADERDRYAWRPRPSMFGGGILSTPLGLNWEPARRVVLLTVWNDFLCMPLVAARTQPEGLFHLPDGNLRFRAQDRLTVMTGCKECHARLEGGVRALAAFTTLYVGERWLADHQVAESARLYGRDSRDLRGEGPSTPAWLGETIVKQPEFAQCMVQHVENLFYGGDAMPQSARDRVSTRFVDKLDFAQLVEDVAIVRLVGEAGLADAAPATAQK